jgi:ABC-2 type transport system permease protein
MTTPKKPYSQSKALWAITKASFKAIFAHPSAIIFSILFPIIFTLIFGAFGSGGATTYRIAIENGSDTSNAFFQFLKNVKVIRIVPFTDTTELNKELIKGRLTAVLRIKENKDSSGQASYTLNTRTTTASNNSIMAFRQILEYMKLSYEKKATGAIPDLVVIPETDIKEVRKFRAIDFILPGQLGFSILFSTLFGIAFTFFGMREQLVLKRFYASPVNRINIVLGIGASRLFFQLLSVTVLILFGHFWMNFTLVNGATTFIEIILLTIVMLFLLMGVGLIFSSVAKNDTAIPLLINLFGFPQMMLSGTFFSIEVFPKWLQEICRILPLTQYNDAVRKISFEGLHIYDCWKELGILGIWIIITYIIVARVIKWE